MPGLPGVAPDYAGASIVNLAASLAAHFGVATGHPGLREPLPLSGAMALCLVIVDGLGYPQLQDLLDAGDMPQLAARLRTGDMRLSAITSVFPTTTAAALTSLYTGLTPAEHGRLGYSVFLGKRVVELLTFRDMATGDIVSKPETISPSTSLFAALRAAGVHCASLMPADLASTPLSLWHSAGAQALSYRSLRSLPQRVHEAIGGERPRYLVVYLPHFDAACHVYGPGSREARHVAGMVDHLIAKVLDGLPPEAFLVLTADHGVKRLDPRKAVSLHGMPACGRAIAGERTLRFVRDSMLSSKALACLSDIADVMPSGAAWAASLFGPSPPRDDIRRRVGQYLLLPRGESQLLAPAGTAWEDPHAGGHGGLSKAEMLVPLLFASPRGHVRSERAEHVQAPNARVRP